MITPDGIRDVHCPHCGAEAGAPCTDRTPRANPHRARVARYGELVEAHEPPKGPAARADEAMQWVENMRGRGYSYPFFAPDAEGTLAILFSTCADSPRDAVSGVGPTCVEALEAARAEWKRREGRDQ